jgi:hypothetical protein
VLFFRVVVIVALGLLVFVVLVVFGRVAEVLLWPCWGLLGFVVLTVFVGVGWGLLVLLFGVLVVVVGAIVLVLVLEVVV